MLLNEMNEIMVIRNKEACGYGEVEFVQKRV